MGSFIPRRHRPSSGIESRLLMVHMEPILIFSAISLTNQNDKQSQHLTDSLLALPHHTKKGVSFTVDYSIVIILALI